MITECKIWTRGRHRSGYGVMYIKRRQFYVHRVTYESVYGKIPKGVDIGHKCHDEAAARGECQGGWSCLHRLCYEISHLVAQTHKENLYASPLTLVSKQGIKDG